MFTCTYCFLSNLALQQTTYLFWFWNKNKVRYLIILYLSCLQGNVDIFSYFSSFFVIFWNRFLSRLLNRCNNFLATFERKKKVYSLFIATLNFFSNRIPSSSAADRLHTNGIKSRSLSYQTLFSSFFDFLSNVQS